MSHRLLPALAALLFVLGCDAAKDSGGIYLQPDREVAPQDMFDLDGDDTADVRFQLSDTICSRDIPPSACSQGFEFKPLLGRATLSHDRSGALEPGAEVGPLPDGEGSVGWSERGAGLVSVHYDLIGGTHEVYAPSEPQGMYVGVRMIDGASVRYGWVRLTASAEVRDALDATFSAVVHEVAIGAAGETVIVGERP